MYQSALQNECQCLFLQNSREQERDRVPHITGFIGGGGGEKKLLVFKGKKKNRPLLWGRAASQF